MHPESAPSVDARVHFFKVYFFVSYSPTVSLNRTKLKIWDYEAKVAKFAKFVGMIESGAIYPLVVKGYFLVHPDSAHQVYHRLHILWGNY